MMFRKIVLTLAVTLPFMFASVVCADDAAQLPPDQLIHKVADDVLKELSAHRAELRKDPKGIRKLVDTYLLPHFDTEYAARLVLGKYWRDATPDQRKRFVDGFYQSMLQNYGEALLDFTPDRLKILPYRADQNSDQATVHTTIRRDNGQEIPVNYTLRTTPEGWKAFDVTIEGISYVRSFKNDFSEQIARNGLESVIKRLESGDVPHVSAKPQNQGTKS